MGTIVPAAGDVAWAHARAVVTVAVPPSMKRTGRSESGSVPKPFKQHIFFFVDSIKYLHYIASFGAKEVLCELSFKKAENPFMNALVKE